jgi:hypothetical protein
VTGVVVTAFLLSSSLLVISNQARAGAKIKIDETKWVSVGAGLRTSFNSVENAAPSGTDRSKDFELDSIRLYVNGQVTKHIKLEFNTERDADGNIDVLDGVAKFEMTDLINVWAGRMLPPSDRSNLSGPYYLNAWNFPSVQAYPNIKAGRDDGAAVWGQTGGGVFKYQAGFFQGIDGSASPTSPNQKDDLLFAGRLVYNFWDPEPGYYNSSTYYGSKDVLAIGLVYQSQSNASGTATDPGDFTGWNLDFLYEQKLKAGGVVSAEAAYYDYDWSNKPVVNPGLYQGNGYFVLGSYLLANKTGWGKFQPMLRYQKLEPDTGYGVETDIAEIGLNYIIDGHNARVALVYGDADPTGAPSTNFVQLGVQLQI